MKNRLVVIYGAGKYGKKLYEIMSQLEVQISYFVQSKIDKPEIINGIKVLSKDELLSINDKLVILYAINDKQFFFDLCKLLESKKASVQLIDCIRFIEDNMLVANIETTPAVGTCKKQCIICGRSFDGFLPSGIKEEIFERHHIIGGGYREGCICPCCKSTDRERWVYYVLKNEINISNRCGRVLHFAPEAKVSKLITDNKKIDYYTGDIVAGKAMHVTDITDIQYADKSMDIIICNHVLEHICDINMAISEIKRVLKDNGLFIFSFPICTDMDTFENSEYATPDERLKYYGQKDHVRLYGKDYYEIYSNNGFDLTIYSPQSMMSKEEINRFGFIEDDILVVGKKIL